jgi:hypothetical protein
MQLLRRILCILALAAASAVHASGVVITVNGPSGWWLVLAVLGLEQRRPVPEPSPHHLSAPPPQGRDACTFVAGVRHCPLPRPRAEPR